MKMADAIRSVWNGTSFEEYEFRAHKLVDDLHAKGYKPFLIIMADPKTGDIDMVPGAYIPKSATSDVVHMLMQLADALDRNK